MPLLLGLNSSWLVGSIFVILCLGLGSIAAVLALGTWLVWAEGDCSFSITEATANDKLFMSLKNDPQLVIGTQNGVSNVHTLFGQAF